MLLFLFACIGGKFSGVYTVDRSDSDEVAQVRSTSVTSNSLGMVELEVPIYEADSSILLTVTSEYHIALETVYDANRNVVLSTDDWYFEDQALTDAFFADARDMVFNWPIRDGDPELTEGTWTIVFSTLGMGGVYSSGREATAYTQLKQDDDLSSGTVSVTIGVAPITESEEGLLDAITTAANCWQTMWASKGIDLDYNIVSVDVDDNLPFPDASPEVEGISEEGSDRDMLMLIGETVANQEGLFGLAGSIPGTLLATERSAVTVSWLEHAGIDGVLSESELQIMCETMAHETGHYMGLYHPVESDYMAWDALEDTLECTSSMECEGALESNLMFPYPICSGDNCVEQVELTSEQQTVLHLYTGTL